MSRPDAPGPIGEIPEEFRDWADTLPKANSEEVDPVRLEQVTRRLRSANTDGLSPRRENLKDLADSVRGLIAKLVATDAPDHVVAAAADAINEVTKRFDGYDRKVVYGFSEAANAGDLEEAIFDQSPLIGLANPLAPPLTLRLDGDTIFGAANFNQAYEGPPGCVHGGYVAAAFDEVLGATQSLSGAPGMTGTLSIRYESPTPLDTDLVFESKISKVERRKIFVEGTCSVEGRVTARATAIFISLEPGTFMQLLAERDAQADQHR